jgi:bacteriocin-like protein
VINAPKSSRRDHLTTTTDESKIELTEQELSRVIGGRKAGGSQYLTYKLTDTLISGY